MLSASHMSTRMRYQKGSLNLRGASVNKSGWVGGEMSQPDGTLKRIHRREVLGTFQDYPSKRLALRLLDERLAELNDFSYKPAQIATFKEFAQRWKTSVLSMHKPSSRVSEKGHISKWLLPIFRTSSFAAHPVPSPQSKTD